MEYSLHRELKTIYAGPKARCEVPLAGFRIDAQRGRQLFEIQHASLAAIRRKVQRLLDDHHPVTVVKPLVARKQILRVDGPGGEVLSRRFSPKRATLLDLFHELVYFVSVFPHARLTIEVPVVEIAERRFATPGRRRRRWVKQYAVDDQQLIRILDTRRLRRSKDLLKLLPQPLPDEFDTAQLAAHLGIQRWVAQRIAYCLRHAGAVTDVGKRGRSRLYQAA